MKNGLFLNVFAFLLLFTLQAQGRVYIVTNTNDTTRITSLRSAIMDANRHGGNNTIILGQQFGRRNQQPVFHLSISGADEDAARTGDLDITNGSLTIIGMLNGAVIDATGLGDRVFQISPRARLTLENLTITGGRAPGNDYFHLGGKSGGAIYNAGTLSLENCIITNNVGGDGDSLEGNGSIPFSGAGGGIFNSGLLTINDCIIAGNSAGMGVNGASGGSGGGIVNSGRCFVTNSIISRNQSGAGDGPDGNQGEVGGSGGNGGGIFNSGNGTMILCGCVISENVAGYGTSGIGSLGGPGGNGGSGAGIYNDGQMQINFCAIYGNICGDGGGGGGSGGPGVYGVGMGGNGAGIFNGGKLSINTSTISDNLCGNGGAGGNGLFGGGDGGAGGSGGGIYNAGSIFPVVLSASLEVTSCTIALNQTGAGGNGSNAGRLISHIASGGEGGDGGGIGNVASSTNVTVRNTLIALNLINVGGAGGTNTPVQIGGEQTVGDAGADGLGFDVAGDFTSQGYNLISAADGSTGFINGLNADQAGSIGSPIDPLIGPLQINGGPTPTHALLPGSPAIDQGNSFGVHTDQRGYHRPYNYTAIANAPGGDGSDIGAFEMGAH